MSKTDIQIIPNRNCFVIPADVSYSKKISRVLISAANRLSNNYNLHHWKKYIYEWNFEDSISARLSNADCKTLVAIYSKNLPNLKELNISKIEVAGVVFIDQRAPSYHPVYQPTLPENVGYISKLAIHSNFIRMEIGALLIAEAEKLIIQQGKNLAALDWYKPAEFLKTYYTSKGYKIEAEDDEGFFAMKNLET